jgi:hypothetical protein
MRPTRFASLLVVFAGCGGGGFPGIVDDDGGTPAASAPPSTSSSAPSTKDAGSGSEGGSLPGVPTAPPGPTQPPPTPQSPLTGAWDGTFASQFGGSGFATLILQSSGGAVTGSVAFVDSPCFSNASVTGTIQSNKLIADVKQNGSQARLSTTINGGTMVGTYSVGQAGECTGDRGTVAFTRKP